MEKRWIVELSQEEREQLEQLIKKGKVVGYKIKHAHMLLKADEGEFGPSWPDTRIAEAYNTSESTVRNLRKRLVEKGFETALEREKQANRKIKFDGETRRNWSPLPVVSHRRATDGRFDCSPIAWLNWKL